MHNIIILNKFGQQETARMKSVPRIGDTVPLFYKPHPKVKEVIWMPHKVMSDISESYDVMLLVE